MEKKRKKIFCTKKSKFKDYFPTTINNTVCNKTKQQQKEKQNCLHNYYYQHKLIKINLLSEKINKNKDKLLQKCCFFVLFK